MFFFLSRKTEIELKSTFPYQVLSISLNFYSSAGVGLSFGTWAGSTFWKSHMVWSGLTSMNAWEPGSPGS